MASSHPHGCAMDCARYSQAMAYHAHNQCRHLLLAAAVVVAAIAVVVAVTVTVAVVGVAVVWRAVAGGVPAVARATRWARSCVLVSMKRKRKG